MVNIMKPDLDELVKQIVARGVMSSDPVRYVVISQGTFEVIEYYSGFTYVDSKNCFSGEVCGVKIAINNTLKLGEVDIV